MRKHIILYCITLLGFLIGIRGGYLAVWEDNDPEPVRVYPLRVSTLPSADQQLLKQGIHAENSSQLTQYLEDFLS